MSNADTGKNPVCANNFKDTTKNVLPIKKTKTKKPSACIFPGINNKMNSFFFQSHHKEEKNHYQATKLSYTKEVVTTCHHVIKKKKHVAATYSQPFLIYHSR